MATILSVREMIDQSLGAHDANTVNFKLLQTVLHVLAQQLRVLERRVELRLDTGSSSDMDSITVTEVRVQAPAEGQPQKKKFEKSRGKKDTPSVVFTEERHITYQQNPQSFTPTQSKQRSQTILKKYEQPHQGQQEKTQQQPQQSLHQSQQYQQQQMSLLNQKQTQQNIQQAYDYQQQALINIQDALKNQEPQENMQQAQKNLQQAQQCQQQVLESLQQAQQNQTPPPNLQEAQQNLRNAQKYQQLAQNNVKQAQQNHQPEQNLMEARQNILQAQQYQKQAQQILQPGNLNQQQQADLHSAEQNKQTQQSLQSGNLNQQQQADLHSAEQNKQTQQSTQQAQESHGRQLRSGSTPDNNTYQEQQYNQQKDPQQKYHKFQEQSRETQDQQQAQQNLQQVKQNKQQEQNLLPEDQYQQLENSIQQAQLNLQQAQQYQQQAQKNLQQVQENHQEEQNLQQAQQNMQQAQQYQLQAQQNLQFVQDTQQTQPNVEQAQQNLQKAQQYQQHALQNSQQAQQNQEPNQSLDEAQQSLQQAQQYRLEAQKNLQLQQTLQEGQQQQNKERKQLQSSSVPDENSKQDPKLSQQKYPQQKSQKQPQQQTQQRQNQPQLKQQKYTEQPQQTHLKQHPQQIQKKYRVESQSQSELVPQFSDTLNTMVFSKHAQFLSDERNTQTQPQQQQNRRPHSTGQTKHLQKQVIVNSVTTQTDVLLRSQTSSFFIQGMPNQDKITLQKCRPQTPIQENQHESWTRQNILMEEQQDKELYIIIQSIQTQTDPRPKSQKQSQQDLLHQKGKEIQGPQNHKTWDVIETHGHGPVMHDQDSCGEQEQLTYIGQNGLEFQGHKRTSIAIQTQSRPNSELQIKSMMLEKDLRSQNKHLEFNVYRPSVSQFGQLQQVAHVQQTEGPQQQGINQEQPVEDQEHRNSMQTQTEPRPKSHKHRKIVPIVVFEEEQKAEIYQPSQALLEGQQSEQAQSIDIQMDLRSRPHRQKHEEAFFDQQEDEIYQQQNGGDSFQQQVKEIETQTEPHPKYEKLKYYLQSHEEDLLTYQQQQSLDDNQPESPVASNIQHTEIETQTESLPQTNSKRHDETSVNEELDEQFQQQVSFQQQIKLTDSQKQSIQQQSHLDSHDQSQYIQETLEQTESYQKGRGAHQQQHQQNGTDKREQHEQDSHHQHSDSIHINEIDIQTESQSYKQKQQDQDTFSRAQSIHVLSLQYEQDSYHQKSEFTQNDNIEIDTQTERPPRSHRRKHKHNEQNSHEEYSSQQHGDDKAHNQGPPPPPTPEEPIQHLQDSYEIDQEKDSKIKPKKSHPKSHAHRAPNKVDMQTQTSPETSPRKSPPPHKEHSLTKFVQQGSQHQLQEGGHTRPLEKAEKKSKARTKGIDKSKLWQTEEQKERELRVIRQRADSREEPDVEPAPMASAPSLHITGTPQIKETILVVERGSRTDVDHGASSRGRISVVTQSQFAQLESQVHILQGHDKQRQTTRLSDLPNDQIIAELRSGAGGGGGGASLSDAMIAMQLGARVEATERGIVRLAELITTVASSAPANTAVMEAASGLAKGLNKPTAQAGPKGQLAGAGTRAGAGGSVTGISRVTTEGCVTEQDLQSAVKSLQTEIAKNVLLAEQRLKGAGDATMQRVMVVEEKLEELAGVDERMSGIESCMRDYADQINGLDTGLSSQMMSFQEQISELQHELEAGLEQAMEGGGAGGDTAAMAEIHARMASLTADVDATITSQTAIEMQLSTFANDMHALLEQIEVMKETKSDREEVEDALRDKADVRALNGMVSEAHFEAIRKDFNNRLQSSADKFHKYELMWQQAIDDLHGELNDKAEMTQLAALRDHLEERLAELLRKIQEVAKAAGEPRAAGVTRRLLRDADCIACSTPAVILPDETKPGVPAIPAMPVTGVRPPVLGAESPDMTGAGEGICYTDWAPPDRAHLCQRYCGGSHTQVPSGVVARTPMTGALKVAPAARRVGPGLGTDGRVYQTEEILKGRPCTPCNQPRASRGAGLPPRTPPPRTPPARLAVPDSITTQPGESECACWSEVTNMNYAEYNADQTPPVPAD